MTDLIIVWDPEQIDTLKEVNNYLKKIRAYQKKKRCKVGVLLTQRMHTDGLYEIISQQEALDELRKPITKGLLEFGIIFYPLSYFLALREKLKGNENYPLPEPVNRRNLDTYRF